MTFPRGLAFGLAEELGEAIVAGRLRSDAHPTEAELVEQFGVSRSVVREAVKMLVSKGLLHGGSGQGTFISPEGAWNLFDHDVLRWLLARHGPSSAGLQLAEIRWGMEPEAAGLAAVRAGKRERSEIRDAARTLEGAMAGGNPLSAAIAFHSAVLEATGNAIYLSARAIVVTGLTMDFRFATTHGFQPFKATTYRKVSAAIGAADPERAFAAMRAVLDATVAFHADFGASRRKASTKQGPRSAGDPPSIAS
jgi:DNA-binding FadR family transcriptional regulator